MVTGMYSAKLQSADAIENLRMKKPLPYIRVREKFDTMWLALTLLRDYASNWKLNQ